MQTQYRFPKELAVFPSQEFYRGKLKTGVRDSKQLLDVLKESDFPWPMHDGIVVPTVFVQCSSEEDLGGMSKSNEGQVAVVKAIITKLTSRFKEEPGTSKGKGKDVDRGDKREPLTITVLTPYRKQFKALQGALPSSVKCSTVDSFQGRESDIIIFSTVRCNVEGDIGFVDDERRLNVMWTRAKLALIIVGDRSTMTEKAANVRWKRAIDSCTEVKVDPAEL
jgi:regulator of nonsense transcripts 1